MLDKSWKHRNKKWKSRWKSTVKYDQDWDGVFLLELIVHKLKLMHEYFASDHVFMAEESLAPIQCSLQQAVELGQRLLEDDYEASSASFIAGHKLYEVTVEVARNGQNGPLKRFCAHDVNDNQSVIENKNFYCKQLRQQGYKECEICVTYTSHWDNPESEKKYKEELLKNQAARKADQAAFFTIIRDHYEEWWD